ncbi:uncharacterized protein TNCT_375241 [Trichonephila clavata]|uniref:Peptidase S1 domain-containing protein n=1 Tax=Trichonephila clavata TaxID=2740835 RepID=A0A8X6H4K5_TRICU|nr:uncharacterized protein TNCT_375241 [Trichonephila clavata]
MWILLRNLICSQWVITAASCFYHEHENNATKKEFEQVTKEVFVSLGERDLMNEERNQHNFYAESIVIHPDFQPIDTLENNLALIKLNVKAPKKRFRPACLPPLERNIQLHLDLNVNASIAGWGQPPSKDNEWEITGSSVHFRSSNISATLEEESVCRRFSKKADDTAVFCAGGHG